MKQSVPQETITHHCILHKEQLCAKTLEMKHIMGNIVGTVNFIRARGLNHRQFQVFLRGLEAEQGDVNYFSQVHWLNRATSLARVWSIKDEIKCFVADEKKEVTFLEDDIWLNDLAF